ncbi:hypothetical protein Fmac_019127 [Flemingia macrophylla]|uniref:Terpene synthase metal-binding domain-containing protein n=1 Tax=Flemingia macrophylla TaxID=520843 RepID=A0ABD1M720_9FABA
MSLAPSLPVSSTQLAPPDITLRPYADFPPGIWEDVFLQYDSKSLINHCLRHPLNKAVLRWWKQSNIMKKVPYARDRLVESYLWSLTMCYRPEHSTGRMFVAKMISFLTILDDTYDVYGTIQELELFTEAILRWDITLIESLPQCMKAVFDMLVELCEEIESLINSLNRKGDVEDCWKVINEACLKANNIPKVALDCVVNLARSFHFLYGDLMDKFTNSELLKDYTYTLLVDPVCINQD